MRMYQTREWRFPSSRREYQINFIHMEGTLATGSASGTATTLHWLPHRSARAQRHTPNTHTNTLTSPLLADTPLNC